MVVPDNADQGPRVSTGPRGSSVKICRWTAWAGSRGEELSRRSIVSRTARTYGRARSRNVVAMDPEMVEVDDGDTVWRFDREFLESRWVCLWGRGCKGIGTEPAEHLGLGCCSVGAEFADVDEARLTAALAATLPPEHFEHHSDATDGGIFSDEGRTAT